MKILETEPYWKQAGIPLNLNHLEVLYQTNKKCKSDWYHFFKLIMKNNMKLEPSNVENFICVVGKKSPKVTKDYLFYATRSKIMQCMNLSFWEKKE